MGAGDWLGGLQPLPPPPPPPPPTPLHPLHMLHLSADVLQKAKAIGQSIAAAKEAAAAARPLARKQSVVASHPGAGADASARVSVAPSRPAVIKSQPSAPGGVKRPAGGGSGSGSDAKRVRAGDAALGSALGRDPFGRPDKYAPANHEYRQVPGKRRGSAYTGCPSGADFWAPAAHTDAPAPQQPPPGLPTLPAGPPRAGVYARPAPLDGTPRPSATTARREGGAGAVARSAGAACPSCSGQHHACTPPGACSPPTVLPAHPPTLPPGCCSRRCWAPFPRPLRRRAATTWTECSNRWAPARAFSTAFLGTVSAVSPLPPIKMQHCRATKHSG